MALFGSPKPVVLKEGSAAEEQLRQMEDAKGTLSPRAEARLEKDLRLVRAGIDGERHILYELKNSHMDMFILQDLFLEHEGLTAQIDFLVITPQRNFVIECKNLVGNIEINSKGDFIRTIRCGGRYYKEGIYSPITQNQRHLQVLKERRSENDGKILAAWKNYLFKDFFRGLVVLANPKTVVNDRYAKKEVKEQVIRADQLIETIKRMNKASKESASSLKDLKEMGERYLQMHIEKPITYIEKFKQEELEDQPAAERPAPAPSEGKCCPKCGKPLVMREARRGAHVGEKFWGCTGFPQCHFIKKIVKTENK